MLHIFYSFCSRLLVCKNNGFNPPVFHTFYLFFFSFFLFCLYPYPPPPLHWSIPFIPFPSFHHLFSPSLTHVSLPGCSSSTTPPLALHLLYCKQLTKAWQGLRSCSLCLPSLFSELFVIVSSLSCVFVSITRSLFCFFPLRQKSKS